MWKKSLYAGGLGCKMLCSREWGPAVGRAQGKGAKLENGVVVRIRLKRFGRRHAAFYRLTAVDSRRPRDGRVLEELGWYAPENTPDKQFGLEKERIEHWLSVGAQPSDTVKNLLTKQGIGKK